MKLDHAYTLQEIAALIGATYEGPAGHTVTGINEIHKVEAGDLVFVDHPKYYDKALKCAATTILIDKKMDAPEGKALIFSDDPFADYNKLTKHFRPFEALTQGVSSSAIVGEGTLLQPNVAVGNHVTIGKNCILHPGVVIYDHCQLGDNVIIHSGTVIGAEAFYFQKREGVFHKMHSCGRVIIENDVEIGAACTVDRGVSGDTVIGAGTKFDNMIHIGHDTVVGKNCLFAAQVGVAGCVIVKDNVTLWGQVGIAPNVTIGEGATVGAKSGVLKTLAPGKMYFGTPAGEARMKYREVAALKKLPEIIESLR
jgi:UDP-3-O-[3-hydroxymyristoyl] glucosamine N-acyltransferase